MHTKLFCALTLLVSTAAFAGAAPKQNHHCKMSDGTMDGTKTKRECKAAKGTWAKDAGDATSAPAAADGKGADMKPVDAGKSTK